jgi:serine protease Do
VIIRLVAILLAVVAPSGAWVAEGPAGPPTRPDTVEELRQLEQRLTEIAERTRPAVVLLQIRERGGSSNGTGVVISSDGLVATCGHVGERAGRRVTATLPDGRRLSGRTLGQANDGALDCGLIQLDVEGEPLPTVPLGTSAAIEPGEWVVSLGYTQGPPAEPRPAFVRAGRITRASDREILFDAPIDAGDSGGPIVNLRGEVVGINSRCGRQPWENAATPVDRLRERHAEFRDGLDEADMAPPLRVGGSGDGWTSFARGGDDLGRLSVQRSAPLAEICMGAERSVLQVRSQNQVVALATVVDANGHAVTKRSELPRRGTLSVRDHRGEDRAARVVAEDRRMDLALLEVGGEPLPGIEWGPGTVQAGQVLVSPRPGTSGPALGFASIERRESERDWRMGAFLGVQTEPVSRSEATESGVESAVRVVTVVEGGAAEEAGLRPGDLLVTLDAQPLSGREGLRRRIMDRDPGDVVTIVLLRDGERREASATLRPRPEREGGTAQRGNTRTEISTVSTGFGEVFAHDAIIRPEQCGGPVLSLDGLAQGLNVARYDRTSTHVLDAIRVQAAVRRMLDSLTPEEGPEPTAGAGSPPTPPSQPTTPARAPSP